MNEVWQPTNPPQFGEVAKYVGPLESSNPEFSGIVSQLKKLVFMSFLWVLDFEEKPKGHHPPIVLFL